MDILRNIITIAAAGLMLTACEQPFEADVAEPETLCINSVITSGEEVGVTISHSWRYDQGYTNDIDRCVYDATVTLSVNGNPVETITPDGAEKSRRYAAYRFRHVASPGEEITISAESGRYGVANGTVTVPQPAGNLTAVSDLKADRVLGADNVNETQAIILGGSLKVTVTDDAATTDFFRLEVSGIDPEAIGSGEWVEFWGEDEPQERMYQGTLDFWMIDKEHETLFQEHLGVLDVMFGASTYGFTIFSDRMFPGKSHTIDVVLRDATIYMYNPRDIPSIFDVRVRITLSTISQSFYNYWLSDFQASEGFIGQLGDLGLAQNVTGYSNVSTNAGVIVASTPTTVEISLADFIRATLRP